MFFYIFLTFFQYIFYIIRYVFYRQKHKILYIKQKKIQRKQFCTQATNRTEHPQNGTLRPARIETRENLKFKYQPSGAGERNEMKYKIKHIDAGEYANGSRSHIFMAVVFFSISINPLLPSKSVRDTFFFRIRLFPYVPVWRSRSFVFCLLRPRRLFRYCQI